MNSESISLLVAEPEPFDGMLPAKYEGRSPVHTIEITQKFIDLLGQYSGKKFPGRALKQMRRRSSGIMLTRGIQKIKF